MASRTFAAKLDSSRQLVMSWGADDESGKRALAFGISRLRQRSSRSSRSAAWKINFPLSLLILLILFPNIANFFILKLPSIQTRRYTSMRTSSKFQSVPFLSFVCLVELAWSVLKPIRGSLTRWALLYIAGMILLAGALLWPFSGLEADTGAQERLLVHLVQTVGFLRVGFFLLLAATSQWLSIGWRDRELQIATGLGFYSLVSCRRSHAPHTPWKC